MKTAEFSKRCHKCDGIVPMTGEEFIREPDLWTTCDRCRRIIETEVRFIGLPAEAPAT